MRERGVGYMTEQNLTLACKGREGKRGEGSVL